MIQDPGNYFCRKGFYAHNVQAICDKRRRVIWTSTGHKGSTHDSTAFMETQLFELLEENADWLEDKGYFIVGDSAYPCMHGMIALFVIDRVFKDLHGWWGWFIHVSFFVCGFNSVRDHHSS